MPSTPGPDFRIETFVFCEEVRPEPGGKFTILGAMPGALTVAGPGAIRASFFTEMYVAANGRADIHLVVAFNDAPILRIEGVVDVVNAEEVVVLQLPTVALPLSGAGELTVDVECGGTSRRAMSRQVRLAPAA
jgi:hypothetical protein